VAFSQASVAPPKLIALPVRQLSLEYLGFRNGRDRREYILCAKLGTASCEYTVWIPNSAFAAGHALFQDGPDICYQKLRRELADVELSEGQSVQVTESELLEYRTAHLPPQRRGPAAKASPTPETRD
jgi:hypothetical protein